jgi:hypothetical protein
MCHIRSTAVPHVQVVKSDCNDLASLKATMAGCVIRPPESLLSEHLGRRYHSTCTALQFNDCCGDGWVRATTERSRARPFVGVFQKSILDRSIILWRLFPSKWLQNRPQIPKLSPGIPPRRVFCGENNLSVFESLYLSIRCILSAAMAGWNPPTSSYGCPFHTHLFRMKRYGRQSVGSRGVRSSLSQHVRKMCV